MSERVRHDLSASLQLGVCKLHASEVRSNPPQPHHVLIVRETMIINTQN